MLCLGSLFRCLIVIMVKMYNKFPRILESLFFQLMPIVFFHPTIHHSKDPKSVCTVSLLQVRSGCGLGPPKTFPSAGGTSPVPSASDHRAASVLPTAVLVALCSTALSLSKAFGRRDAQIYTKKYHFGLYAKRSLCKSVMRRLWEVFMCFYDYLKNCCTTVLS